MGQQHTVIHNEMSVQVKVMVTHSNGDTDLFRLDPNDYRVLETKQGQVFVAVYDPYIEEEDQDPYEGANATLKALDKELHFFIEENSLGGPRIVNESTRQRKESSYRNATTKWYREKPQTKK